MSSVFGFSTEASAGGDIIPIVKYDARAGRVFRVDRVNDGQGFVATSVDITKSFKALVDMENIETGWINFATGGVPSFTLVPLGTAIPPQPTSEHRNGIRLMVKLSQECGGEERVREIAGVAKVLIRGVEELYHAWLAEKDANPGKLPVVTLEDTTPVTSGSGAKASTNYQPKFKIVSWAPRGDLVFKPKNSAAPAAVAPKPAAAPSTGSTVVSAPPPVEARQPEMADDFG